MKKYSYAVTLTLLLASCDKLHDFFPKPQKDCTGSALQFDGVNDYVKVNHPFYNFTNQLTVEWWANIDSSSQLGSGIGQAKPNSIDMSTSVWLMHYDPFKPAQALRFYVNDNGTWHIAATAVPRGWHHWAGVADATSVRLYMDGKQVGTTGAGMAQIQQASASAIAFGKDIRYAGERWMKGSIDEVRVWNTALTQHTIKKWMDMPLSSSHPDYSNLKGYWKLDEGKGTRAHDASSVKADGSLIGGPTWLPETQTCKCD